MNNSKTLRKKKLPIWLRKLHLVKNELQSEHWLSSQQGFRQALELMSWGLEILNQTEDKEELRQLFTQSNTRWIHRWKKERARLFPSEN